MEGSVGVEHLVFVWVEAVGLHFDGGMGDAELRHGHTDGGDGGVEFADVVDDNMYRQGILGGGERPDRKSVV